MISQDTSAKIDAEAALAGAGLLAAAAAGPLLLAKAAPWRIVWANPQVAGIFGTTDLRELTRICLNGPEPGARQLARLADRMDAAADVADLRLRLRVRGVLEMIALSCRKLASGSYFAIAPWGATVSATEAAAENAAAHQAVDVAPDSPAAEIVETGAAAAHEARVTDKRGNVRFLWRTDRNGMLSSITGALCEVVGCNPAELIGRNFREAAAEMKLDRDGKLREALSRRDTWSGIEVLWPLAGQSKCVPVVLGGLPGFDRARDFDGFSGFGVIHLDRIVDAPEEVAETQEAAPIGISEKTAATDELAAPTTISAHDDEADILDREEFHTPAPQQTASNTTPDAETKQTHEALVEQDVAADAITSAVADTGMATSIPDADDTEATAPDEDTPRPKGDNVVPIRAWQREQRSTFAVTETPNFLKPKTPEKVTPQQPAETPEPSAPAPTEREELVSLSPAERNAFREIARALSARNHEKSAAPSEAETPATPPRTPVADIPPAETEVPAASAEPDVPVADTPAISEAVPHHDTAGDLRRLIERLDAGVLVSRGGVPAFVNKTLLDMLGFSSIDDFYRSGGIERMFRGRDPDILSREADGGAIPVISSSGDVLALDGRVQSIEWDNEPATLMTFRRTQGPEMNARIRALELELRQREAEARETHAILDTATDGVALIDEEGRILTLNKSGQALFGYEQNEVAGESFSMLLARESQAPAMDYLNGLKSNGVKSLLNDGREVTGRARQGGTIPLFMTIGRVGSASPQKFCAVLRDLTQWKKVERELSEAKREAERTSALKSDFLAKVSHEVRTPLNAILGFAEVIMDERFGPVGNERYKDYLKDIHSSGTHVLSLVNDLLDLSKIEAGKLDLNFGAVDANRIVNECVSLIQPQATRERVIIRLSLAPRLPNVVADERSLRQIVLNILSNAVKFNEPGGQVIVSTALTDAGHAVIRIRDTGIGMNEKELEMALEPFRQVATSRPTTGTGLGLPLTKALVEANRASFTIKSRKGEGTLVEVSFPQTRVLAE